MAELELAYHLEERIPLDGAAPYRHVERWRISVHLARGGAGADGDHLEIGYAQVLIFNLETGVGIGDLVDAALGTWIEPGTVVPPRLSEPGRGDARDDGPGGHILLLDRVWLELAHRGRGLGPVVAAAVIIRLRRGCRLAACYPAPFEDSSQTSEARARSIEALGAIWAKVGFRPWRDGVWMIDLRDDDTHTTLLELLAERSSGATGP